MKTPDLENCPHCGKASKIKYINKPFMHGWVGCPECHCYINWVHDPGGAIKAWNRRA